MPDWNEEITARLRSAKLAPVTVIRCYAYWTGALDHFRYDQIGCLQLAECARADAGFYCWDAVEAYEKGKASFLIVARKTQRLLEELHKARWKPSPKTDGDEQCEFWY